MPTPTELAEILRLHREISAVIDLQIAGEIDSAERSRRFSLLDDQLTPLIEPFVQASMAEGVDAAQALIAVLPGGFYRSELQTWLNQQHGDPVGTASVPAPGDDPG